MVLIVIHLPIKRNSALNVLKSCSACKIFVYCIFNYFDHVLVSLSRKTYYKFFLLSLFHPREIGDGAWDSWTMPLFQQVTLG